jgi:hypothetical protein
MAKLRVTAEWMFKDVDNIWTYLTFPRGLKAKMQPVGLYYLVATDLTNIRHILHGASQTSMYFKCPLPSLEEYLAPRIYDDDDPMVAVPDVLSLCQAVRNADLVQLSHTIR